MYFPQVHAKKQINKQNSDHLLAFLQSGSVPELDMHESKHFCRLSLYTVVWLAKFPGLKWLFQKIRSYLCPTYRGFSVYLDIINCYTVLRLHIRYKVHVWFIKYSSIRLVQKCLSGIDNDWTCFMPITQFY
jgi:hypothetical protein